MLFKKRNFKHATGASPSYFDGRVFPFTLREFVAFYVQL